MKLVAACRSALDRFQDNPIHDVIASAAKCAAEGDGQGVAEALSVLADEHRFLATAALEAHFSDVAGEAATQLERAIEHSGAKIDWGRFADPRSMEAWARALAARDHHDLVGRLVNYGYHGTAAKVLARMARSYIATEELETARLYHSYIHIQAKRPRALVRAAIGLAGSNGADLKAAIAEAGGKPIIQDGGEEVEALAAVLDALSSLKGGHPAVRAAVDSMVGLCRRYVHRKDVRSQGVSMAVVTCAKAGASDRVWLEHAKRLRSWVYHWRCQKVADDALAGKWGHSAGTRTAAISVRSSQEISREKQFTSRARAATVHIGRALTHGRTSAVLEALTIALVAPSEQKPTDDEQVAWGAALLASGRGYSRQGTQLLLNLARTGFRRGKSPGPTAPESLWAEIGAFDPASGMELLEIALTRGFAANSYGGHDQLPVAQVLAPFALSAELETRLLEAVVVVKDHENEPRSQNTRFRRRRIASVLGTLATLHAEDGESGGSLDRWANVLRGDDRCRLAAAVDVLAPLGLAEVIKRCGRVESDEGPAMCGALAKAGHFDDALALVEAIVSPESEGPRVKQRALLAIAHAELDPAHAKTLITRYRKTPTGGRDRDSQETYKHRFAQLVLELGDVDASLKVLASMKECRIAKHGPAYLSREIARRLSEQADLADPGRISQIIDVLAGSSVIAQKLAPVVCETLWRLYCVSDGPSREAIERCANKLRKKLKPGDSGLVDAGLATAHAKSRNIARSHEGYRTAVDRIRQGPRQFFVASRLFEAATLANLAKTNDELFADVCLTFPLGRTPSASHAVGILDAQGRAILALTLCKFPQQHAEPIGEALATIASQRGEIGVFNTLLNDLPDSTAALRRVRQVAIALARAGKAGRALDVADLVSLG